MNTDLRSLFAKHSGTLDSAESDEAGAVKPVSAETVALDSVLHENRQNCRIALDSFLSLTEISEEDLDEGEHYGDRLQATFAGIGSGAVFDNSTYDYSLSDDDHVVIDSMRTSVGGYLDSIGCDNGDIEEMLNDFTADATERCLSHAAESLDDGEDAVFDAVDSYAFGCFDATGGDATLDSTLDATYKKTQVMRNGKKTFINKRVSGTVRLSAKQKKAVKKMQRKAHSSRATLKRKRTMAKAS